MGAKKEEHLQIIKDLRVKAKDAASTAEGMPVDQSREFLQKSADDMESQLSQFDLTPEQRTRRNGFLQRDFQIGRERTLSHSVQAWSAMGGTTWTVSCEM